MDDIRSREDIENLMAVFYDAAFRDELIGHIFTDVAKLDLEEHLPVISDFWEDVVLGSRKYPSRHRNPMQVHLALAAMTPLHGVHFERWLEIFETVVNEHFDGENAKGIKMRAASIARRMRDVVTNYGPDLTRPRTAEVV